MSVEQAVEKEITLDEALRIVHEDQTLYLVSYGENGAKATKQEIYKKFLGDEARDGWTKIVDGKEKYIPGYYDKYPSLSTPEIDAILTKYIFLLANAQVLILLESLIEGELTKAASSAAKSTKT